MITKTKYKILAFLLIVSQGLFAQIIADFETPETTPPVSAEGATEVVDNPDKSGINTSDKVGYYKKIEGNWRYVTLDYTANPVDVSYNNTLTFKVYTSSKGRVFAKFWNGGEVLAQEWAPEWEFMPEPNTWVECKMDLSEGMWGSFTQLQLAMCVDNPDLEEADVYFDDVKISNPDAGDGSPKVIFTASKTKIPEGESIEFDASNSYGYGAELVKFEWNFGDGVTETGKTVSHTFTKAQNATVSLTLTDDQDRTSTDSTVIFVFGANEIVSAPVWNSGNNTTNNKVEALFQINKNYTNVFDSDEVVVDAIITLPDDSEITVPCFYFVNSYLNNTNWLVDSSYQGWMLRFSSAKEGVHTVKFKVSDTDGVTISDSYSLNISKGATKGIIYSDVLDNQYYRHQTGEPFFPMGINIGWNNIDSYTQIINNLTEANANVFRYWHTPFATQALEWTDNHFYEGLGHYSQQAAAMTDSLINLGEATDMYMQLVIFQHGMFSENVNEMWEDNPYNTANGGFVDRAEEYFYNDECKHEAKKLLRYIVARWGYSKNIFAWEFFNEVQFTGIHNQQTSKWFPGVLQWHQEMSDYVESIDPFNHIMTTSAEHDQLLSFDTIPALDNIQYHLYSNKMLDNQTELDYHFIEELDNLSIVNGEYGTNNDAQTPFDMQRNSIWNSIITEVPHYMWIWDVYMQKEWANLFDMPTDFIKGEDFVQDGDHRKYEVSFESDIETIVANGLSNGNNFYIYVYDDFNSTNISGLTLKLKDIPYANYDIKYYQPVSGEVTVMENVPLIKLTNKLELPDFANGMAVKIKYSSKYELPIAIAGTDTTIAPGLSVEFTGALSFSQVTDATLSYLWAIDEKPAGSASSLSATENVETSLIPDVAGTYKVSLVVNDGFNNSLPDVVTILASTPPVAVVGNDTAITDEDNYFDLDGSASYDADGDDITYKWTLLEYPEESRGSLYDFEESIAKLKLDAEGVYKAQLVVNDGISDSEPAVLTIDVNTVGVNDQMKSKLLLYPNPSNGTLFVDANVPIKQIEVFDVVGNKIYSKSNNSNKVNIDLSGTISNNGVYLVKITRGETVSYKRIVFRK